MTNFEKISDKTFLHFNLKDFIFHKYICKATYNTYDNPYSVAKVDYRGAAAPKNPHQHWRSDSLKLPNLLLLKMPGS